MLSSDIVDDRSPQSILASARARGLRSLDEPAGKQVLAAFGLTIPASRVVHDCRDLDGLEGTLRAPYVLKVVSSDVLHKSDVGGVVVGLQRVSDVAREIEQMRSALQARGLRAERWLVEEMAPPGLEFVIGGVADPEFGPMLMAGLGGVFVEVLKDVAFRICPIARIDALEMLEELRGAALLHGARGRYAVDLDVIVDALLKVGGANGVLMACAADVVEVDINPLIVGAEGAVAVDARFILRKKG